MHSHRNRMYVVQRSENDREGQEEAYGGEATCSYRVDSFSDQYTIAKLTNKIFTVYLSLQCESDEKYHFSSASVPE